MIRHADYATAKLLGSPAIGITLGGLQAMCGALAVESPGDGPGAAKTYLFVYGLVCYHICSLEVW